jgi:basic membrane lipoprotein Med (substrate-binding protein (PBP1-ABC) superfamily)/DNA-binding SARP family transcriptional activator
MARNGKEKPVEYRVLGSLEVRSDGEPVALGPPKQRAILAILLLHAGEIVPIDRLIDLAWGERPPRTATHSVQIYVSELRKALDHNGGGPVIETRPPGYVLEADPETIDVRRFERLLAQGSRELEAGDPAAAEAAIREALGLWRGPPLSDFAYDEFAQDDIHRLEGLRVDALEASAAAEIALGREQAALPSIEAAIAEDPLRERSRELQLMALYRAGRQPEALRAYQQFRALLADELGVEPSPSLQLLQERVLLRDPGLAPSPIPGATPAPAPTRNPYKGLRPFGEEDAGDFFGRETLVAGLAEALAAGRRLIALVGPSGSGKSSVVNAGLLPALESGAPKDSGRWLIARMMPGQQPFEELESALRQAAPEASPGLTEQLDEGDADLLQAARGILSLGSRLLLVIDQFEELFSFGEGATRSRFLGNLTTAVTDPGGQVSVVLALRADFYDRPLLHPGFASVFVPGVANVLPMTADDLEAVVVRPAQRVGIDVDPALLAQLVADTVDQPGALPLLQYTLTDLFERRTRPTLTLEDYRALGGLHGALSRRAEELYGHLAGDRRRVALQVFLRLVRLSQAARHSRRRVPLAELTTLELDPVALSEVLEAFGRHRLLSFDRDPESGNATVEVAHEALLWEWERLAGWIDQYRADLRQHDSFVAAAAEWEGSGRNPDYLLAGSRLAQYETWSSLAALQLTVKEREFLGAGIERRRSEEAAEAARLEQQRQLERRARWRLRALLGTIALLAAAGMFAVLTWLGSGPPDVVLLYEGSGDRAFGDMAMAAVDRAVTDFGLDVETATVSFPSNEVEAELRRISEEGVDLVIVGLGADATDVDAAVAVEHPDTRYVVWENWGELPGNVTNLEFRSEEGAYLAGAAAALTSRTGTVGFIGGWKVDIIDAYLAGYAAGARSVDPGIEVLPTYLASPPDLSAFNSPQLGAKAADQLYAEGADVILAAAGSSGLGVFETARSGSRFLGRQLWAIGVDSDEYVSVLGALVPEGQDPAAWQAHILTSVRKRLDEAFYTVLAEYAGGSLAPGVRSFGLAEGGIDISYSGGFIDDIRPRLEALRDRIISGEIDVPAVPDDTIGTQMP